MICQMRPRMRCSPDLNNIPAADVDARSSRYPLADSMTMLLFSVIWNAFEVLRLAPRQVEHTLVDGIRNAVVDELGKHQAVLALVEHLEGIGGERQASANIGIAGEHRVDVAGEFGTLVLVDGVVMLAFEP